MSATLKTQIWKGGPRANRPFGACRFCDILKRPLAGWTPTRGLLSPLKQQQQHYGNQLRDHQNQPFGRYGDPEFGRFQVHGLPTSFQTDPVSRASRPQTKPLSALNRRVRRRNSQIRRRQGHHTRERANKRRNSGAVCLATMDEYSTKQQVVFNMGAIPSL